MRSQQEASQTKRGLDDQSEFRTSTRWEKVGPQSIRGAQSASDDGILSQKVDVETHKEEVIERTQQTEHATLQPTPKELPSLAELYNFLNPEFRALLSVRGGLASAKRT